ncbi:MAG: hypothetical protein ACI4I6_05335 [Hominimerdicola sp.]
MKKILAGTISILMMFGTSALPAFADANEQANVYVTISDSTGKLALAQEEITVTDIDNDDKLTINDALYATHEAKYNGGAAEGYESAETTYGLSLNKLWGTANGGSYGYRVNNLYAMSLADEINEGDYINAYVYTDLTAWSDKYSYFDVNTATVEAGESITLTLTYEDYDSDYNPITVPAENATITLNGETTEYKTDSDGKVTFSIADEGEYIISAVSDAIILVPPVCKAAVSANRDSSNTDSTNSDSAITSSTTTSSNSSNTNNSNNTNGVTAKTNSTISSTANSENAQTGVSTNFFGLPALSLVTLSGAIVLVKKNKSDEK